jgi:hypothetical protein
VLFVGEQVNSLDVILAKKVQTIVDLRSRLATFKSRLKEEEQLSTSFSKIRVARQAAGKK